MSRPPTDCCTSDFTDNGLLEYPDLRLLYIWFAFVPDKNGDLDSQLTLMNSLYTTIYGASPPEIAVEIPKVECSDYDGDGAITMVDVRIYWIWKYFVDHADPEATQKTRIDTLYPMFFPTSPPVTTQRVPKLLTPANCAGERGWFVCPWIDDSNGFGWLE